MYEVVSSWIVGVLVTIFGLVGLILASGARDAEMLIFGYGLAIFAIVFIGGTIKRHYDAADAARHALRMGADRHD